MDLVEQKMTALETMGRAVAHEFNNILSTITYSAELALEDIPEETITHTDIDRILQTGTEAAAFISDFLSFCKPAVSGFKKTDICNLVTSVTDSLKASFPESITADKKISSDPIHCFLDRSQITDMISQLIENACSSLSDSGGSIMITVQTGNPDKPRKELGSPNRFNHYAVISISDNGPGIEADLIPRIFDPFFTTKTKEPGRGLGLPMVYGIVKQHNGSLEVKSIPFKKTVFTIYLPLTDN